MLLLWGEPSPRGELSARDDMLSLLSRRSSSASSTRVEHEDEYPPSSSFVLERIFLFLETDWLTRWSLVAATCLDFDFEFERFR